MSGATCVCVMVTVPTEQQELRFTPRSRAQALQEHPSMEQVLRRIVAQLHVEHIFWTHDEAGGQLQARIDLLQDEHYERLLGTLQDWGIGERAGTHVTAFKCLETHATMPHATTAAQPGEDTAQLHSEGERLGWQSFVDSVRCRLNVNQVVRVVRRDATINFDFVVLLMAAALLSCVGLVENSFLFLSSSMLISPLMGPIIAAIFGSVIGDHGLRWLGVRNELIGIGISVVTGFLFGLAICLCGLGRFFVLSDGFTEEIISRCDTHSLAIGLCTALVSGAAAAIGVLGGNTGSLVGVAISASLLPPAVNAGLLWAIALCTQLMHVEPRLLASLGRHHIYSQQLHVELFVCATVSMGLTLINVVCVWLMGVVVLRIKEVAPAVQRDQQFWRHDVRLAREVALYDPELHSAIDRLDLNERRHLDLDAPHYQHTWSPGSATVTHATEKARKEQEQEQDHCNYHTVHGFRDFCLTVHKLNSELPPAGSVALPRFIEVFTPPPTLAPAAALPAACEIANYRSLPDLREPPAQSTSLPTKEAKEEAKARTKLPRCVHWHEEREGQPEQCPRSSGQVLLPLPLPPDRSLQLLQSRVKNDDDDKDDGDYEHEFNV